ncbi:MAG: putative redox protein [Gammaproteobacteria bacterium]|jgi:putative redox protein
MKITVAKKGKLAFEATTESGHSVIMDSSPDVGGENTGARPMEMLLVGLGGCSSIDVLLMLEKGRQIITDCRVEVTAERADDYPKVFTRIHLHFIVEGKKVSGKQVQRAINLSAEKYCSATIMLAKTAEITHDYEIIET